MENENKNGAFKRHKKNRHQKPKAYFIEPPASNDENTFAQKNNGTEERETKQHNANQNSKQNKNHKHNEARNDTSPSQKNAENEERSQSNEKKHQKFHNKHNRPKNKHVSLDASNEINNTETEKNISASVGQNKNAKKSYENPLFKQASLPTENVNKDDYEEIRFPSVSEERTLIEIEKTEKEEEIASVEVVGIRFKSSGKVYYFSPNGVTLKRGEGAIVETARGLEFGEVAMSNKLVKESETVPPLRPVVRKATEADIKHHIENKEKEEESFKICNEKIVAHGLDMKLIDAQYTFDNSKLLFYFTSSGRVDFRELVKDLASVFKTRIELRQIGIRDEAKIMGGMGMCGRPLCCTLFLSDFGQVSIKMAKEQNLSLNSAKISGICGRLMCCLRYEHETYEYEIKRTPPVDALVKTADGNGTVTEISPLAGTVKVRLTASPDTPPKTYKREDVVMLKMKQGKDKDSDTNDK